GDHARLRRAGDGADDDRVEEEAELRLLTCDLLRPARVAEPAQRVVGRPRGDRVRLAARRLDVGERLLPALLEADPEVRLLEPHVGAEDPTEEDVPDAVVDRVRPLDP